MNSFSYQEYANIINILLRNVQIMDFGEINEDVTKFVIIRHDVEFSVERAYKIAYLEHLLGVNSSYFFQIRNNAYNLFSKKNLELVQEINRMGHKIGLHVHLGMLKNLNNITDYILNEKEILENISNIQIDRFSFHRPTKEVLRLNLKIDGLVNTYGEQFFDFIEEDLFDQVKIKYIADSMHRWKYGYPDESTIIRYPKIQLLIHPDEWTVTGYNTDANFMSLKNEKIKEFNKTIKTECNHFNKDFCL
jgi:hypothetical protein